MISSWQILVKVCVSHAELQPVTSLVQTVCRLGLLHTRHQHKIISPCAWFNIDAIGEMDFKSFVLVLSVVESTGTNCGGDHQHRPPQKQMWMSFTSLLSGALRTISLWVAPVSRSTLNPIISTRAQMISPLRQLVILQHNQWLWWQRLQIWSQTWWDDCVWKKNKTKKNLCMCISIWSYL